MDSVSTQPVNPNFKTAGSPGEKKQCHYDKYACLNNIRELLKAKGIKIGQLEAEAGLQPGYISRLIKPDNAIEPSLELVVTASKMLGVNVDSLLQEKPNVASEPERYLMNFTRKLISDTQCSVLAWHMESPSMIARSYSRESIFPNRHPLMPFHVPDSSETEFCYESRALGLPVYIKSWSYFAKLPGSESEIYIFPISSPALAGEVYEVYLAGPDSMELICCTAETSNSISQVVRSLFCAAERYCTHIHLTERSRSRIDSYMNYSN